MQGYFDTKCNFCTAC